MGKALVLLSLALLPFIEKWKNTLEQDEYDDAVLMDLQRAFDTINFDILLEKLGAYGLACFLKRIKSFFNESIVTNGSKYKF